MSVLGGEQARAADDSNTLVLLDKNSGSEFGDASFVDEKENVPAGTDVVRSSIGDESAGADATLAIAANYQEEEAPGSGTKDKLKRLIVSRSPFVTIFY